MYNLEKAIQELLNSAEPLEEKLYSDESETRYSTVESKLIEKLHEAFYELKGE